MPTKPTTEVKSASSQRDQRWLCTVYDQHKSPRFPNGRPWWGYLEYPTEKQHDPAFTCELQPGDHTDPFNSVWSAPWVPTQLLSKSRTYYRLDYQSRRITWLYSAMIADERAALSDYFSAAAKIAYEKGWDAPEPGDPVSFKIRAILGDGPMGPKIAEAALAGDPWILGIANKPNEVLQAILAGRPALADAHSQGVVTPEQVLSSDPAVIALVQRMIDSAVEKALEADKKKRTEQKLANLRGGHKHASTAAPSGA